MAVDRPDTTYPRIAADLLGWYDVHARDLPWRARPLHPPTDPYRVWLSEIMLQQTTVAAVRPYFEAFTGRWPDVPALAAADEGELMAAWAGLGYYARARNLIACARAIVNEHQGRFPDNEQALRQLPGIGAYTAAAITAIAFGRRAVVVDANVERVTGRLFAVSAPLPGAKPLIHSLTDMITPHQRCGDFAQAMMDLGATICTTRTPKCLLCPIARHCRGQSDAEHFPVKPSKAARPERRGSIFWAEGDGKVLLHRRPPKGLLGGMIALPTGPWSEQDPGLAEAPFIADWKAAGRIRHVFTHFALDIMVYRAAIGTDLIEGLWWPVDRIHDAGLPTLFAKAAKLIREGT